MRVVLDPALDVEAWTGERVPGAAQLGGLVVGPRGFVRALGPRVGRATRALPRGLRTVRLAAALVQNEGFWSEAAARDSLGVAAQLLAARDALVWGGARGLGGRPGALLKVGAAAGGGLADRARAIVDALDDDAGVEGVVLHGPREGLPPLAREALARLEGAGVPVEWRPLRPTRAEGDLASARADERFEARGDGSFTLARPGGPVAAADQLAAWLASAVRTGSVQIQDVVIVEPTDALDVALARAGLPRTGARAPAGATDSALFLALYASGREAPDVDAARALLRRAPLDPEVRRGLLRALDDWPAVFSEAWEEASAPEVGAFFSRAPEPEVRSWRYLKHRLALTARVVGQASGFVGRMRAITETARRLRADGDVDEGFVHRLVSLALDDTGARWARAPEAGFAIAGAPGAVIAPAPVVIWADARAREASRWSPWSAEEQRALAAAGVEVEPDGELALRSARRAVDLAERCFIGVCPRRDASGAEASPHAVLEEVLARSRGAAPEWPSWDEGEVPRRRAKRTVSIAAPSGETVLRPPASPTAIERLLACPLRFALERVAPAHAEPDASRATERRAVGSLAHEVVAAVLLGGAQPAGAAAAARAHLDAVGARRVASLYAAERVEERRGVEDAIASACAELTRLLAAAGATVAVVEERLEGEVDGLETAGRPDLVVARGGERAVIDLKWGGASFRRRTLAAGESVQLAAYGALSGAETAAYFIISAGELLVAGEGVPLPGERVAARAPEAGGLRAAVEADLAKLASGTWGARPLDDGDPGAVAVAPPCGFCPWDLACGRFARGGRS